MNSVKTGDLFRYNEFPYRLGFFYLRSMLPIVGHYLMSQDERSMWTSQQMVQTTEVGVTNFCETFWQNFKLKNKHYSLKL
jgi:hypothetical protein